MRIGELAKQADVGVETVRFYEQKGLIEQPIRPVSGGYRSYPAQIVRRISFIRSAQQIGFSLTEIAELLALEAAGETGCLEVRRRAKTKRAQVQCRIENLQRIEKALNALIADCPGKGPAQNCSILEAINHGGLHLLSEHAGDEDDQ